MTIYTVTTQQELDAALAKAGKYDDIIIRSEPGVWLTVTAYDNSTVSAFGSSTVRAYGSSTVTAYGSSTVTAYDSSTVRAYESSTVRASDSSTVRAYESSTVSAYDSSTVTAYDTSTVTASDSSTVRAYESSTVRASDSSTVRAYESSTVRAYDSSTVTASDSSTVRAYGNSTVRAGSHVAVHLHSKRVTVEGGVVIDVTDLDLTDPAAWCEHTGAQIDGDHVTVYKAVNADMHSGWDFHYPIGETVTAPDWRDTDACGGGLHFGPTPSHAEAYYDGTGPARFLACRVPLAGLRPITRSGTAKCKAQTAEVLHEVDVHGRRLTTEVPA